MSDTTKLIPPITLDNIGELNDALVLLDELMIQEQENNYSCDTEHILSITKLIDNLQFELKVIENDLLEAKRQRDLKKNRILPDSMLYLSQENLFKAVGELQNKERILITNQDEFLSRNKKSSDYKYIIQIADIKSDIKIFIEIEKKGIYYFVFNPYSLNTVLINNSLIITNGQIIRKNEKLQIIESQEEYLIH